MRTLTKVILFFLSVACSITAYAQTAGREPDIRHRLEMIEKGQIEAVRSELPALMTNYQNNAGVMYLQAVLTTDGAEAAKLYQNIIDNFPKSEWADDAMYKLYQYYYSIGLYKTAEQKLNKLKEDYPFSAYAAEQSPASEEKPVSKEKPAEDKPAVVKVPDTVPKFATNFTVQVGAFSTLQNASELKSKFEKEGFTCNIFTIVSQGKKLHKVWVGEFQTYDEAKKLTAEIKQKFNLSSMVVSR
jgi:cell division septation protein DedD